MMMVLVSVGVIRPGLGLCHAASLVEEIYPANIGAHDGIPGERRTTFEMTGAVRKGGGGDMPRRPSEQT
jgi:hypothetical protein